MAEDTGSIMARIGRATANLNDLVDEERNLEARLKEVRMWQAIVRKSIAEARQQVREADHAQA
jgi:hypothetical protein